jgi:hypothetical protein
MAMADPDPIADLRRKFLQSLQEAARPTLRQVRVWEFLRWSYQRREDNRPAVPPADVEWMDQALSKLDDLDG